MSTKNKIKIIFMGTPQFAVPSLEALCKKKDHYKIVAVITNPDKPQGRGQHKQPSAIKIVAQKKSLLILEPESFKDENFLKKFLEIKADMVIVVAYGKILPKSILKKYKYGIINLHPSLLPKYRGAAPIHRAIINGETETGITTIFLDEGIDSGNILLQQKIIINFDDNYNSLSYKLSYLGAELILNTIEKIITNSIIPKIQNHLNVIYAPKINKNESHILWNNSVKKIVNLIRGLSPIPGAYGLLDNKKFKIFSANYKIIEHKLEIGTIFLFKQINNKNIIVITAKNGFILPHKVQLEGKKILTIEEFIKGHKIFKKKLF